MAGVSSPAMAAAVSEAGALGSIGIGAASPSEARAMILDVQSRTQRPFNVNVFVHQAPRRDKEAEAAWLSALAPTFARFQTKPPATLSPLYKSFADDDETLKLLRDARPAVVSFHFGLPAPDRLRVLKEAGCCLIASATNFREADAAVAAGIDAIVAQGWEAGGHRGMFDPDQHDDRLGMSVLTRLLVKRTNVPIVAAGGIMDGQGIRAVLELGAIAAQLGTAFIACPESAADRAYRAALFSEAARHTTMTRAISGRPARCLANGFTRIAEGLESSPPDYPVAYDAGKALHAAAKTAGHDGFGAQWAGQGAPLARTLPAADLIAILVDEIGGQRQRSIP